MTITLAGEREKTAGTTGIAAVCLLPRPNSVINLAVVDVLLGFDVNFPSLQSSRKERRRVQAELKPRQLRNDVVIIP